MHNSEYREDLLNRAAEGEPLDDTELRDLGAALVQDPHFAEEFLLARRIAQDAPQLARTQAGPRAGFADRLMAAVAQEPMPRSAPGFSLRAWVLGAVAALAVLAVGLALLPAASAWNPSRGLSWTVSWATDAAGAAWRGAAGWLAQLDVAAAWTRFGAGWLGWAVPLLVLAAGALNLWMAQRSSGASGEGHHPR